MHQDTKTRFCCTMTRFCARLWCSSSLVAALQGPEREADPVWHVVAAVTWAPMGQTDQRASMALRATADPWALAAMALCPLMVPSPPLAY